MNKITNGIISGFSIAADKFGQLGIVVTVAIDAGNGCLAKPQDGRLFQPEISMHAYWGFFELPALEAEQLVDSEVRVQLLDGEVHAIGHRTEQRFWQVSPGYLRLVA